MKLQSNKISFKGQNIYVGIDVHLKTWSVTILLKDSNYKKTFTQPASPKALFEHLKKNYPGGIYHAVYESGFSGYSSCYELRDLGVDCIITHAADVPTSQKGTAVEDGRGGFCQARTFVKQWRIESRLPSRLRISSETGN